MAQGRPVGTMFAEIGLDATRLEKGLAQTEKALVEGTIKVESAYKSLGIKSDAVYDQMRKNAVAAVDFIKTKTLSSTEEISRAQEAAARKIKQINDEQFGHQATLIEKMKGNWIAASAAIVVAWMAVNKAMAWAEIGAKAQQAEDSFRIVAAASGESADKIIADMKRAAQGTVDDSDIMQKAVKGMVLGLKGDEMVKIMEAARVSARVAGEDVKTAYEAITNAISTGMPRALKKYGLATKEETAIVEQALKAGVTEINLYELAMRNAGIQAAKFGALNATSAEGVQIFKAQVQETTEAIGKFVVEVVTKAYGVLKTFAALLTYIAAPIAYITGGQEAWNAALASADDLLRQVGDLTGENAKKAGEANAANAAASAAEIKRLEAEKKAWLDKLKAQTEAAKGGDKGDPATERRLREVAKMYAEEGKIVHDALMAEMGANEEYKLTLKKMDDEAWAEQRKGMEAQRKFEEQMLKEKEDALRESFLAETGMTQEYLDTIRKKKDADYIRDQKANEEKMRQLHAALGDMAYAFQSLSTMYDENSDQNARMQEAAKAMIVLQQAVAVANAVAAIANQGLGDPYTAFARIAAMAAAMGSLLASIGATVGGGASSATALPASTVLGGEPGQASESIAKVWELLQDTYDLENRELTGIHDQVRSLNQNITGLMNSIVRGGGNFTAGGYGIDTSFAAGSIEKYASKYIDGVVKIFTLGFLDTIPGLGKAVGKVFGGGKTSTLEGAGVQYEAQRVGNLLADEYMKVAGYALVKTVKEGGWFRKDKTSWATMYQSLGEDTERLFTLAFKDMGQTLVGLAKEFGTSTRAAMMYVFEGARIDLTGKTGDEIGQALMEHFSAVGDKAVSALFGRIVEQYQQVNEGLLETAVRLVVDMAVVTSTLNMTGQAFVGTKAQMVAFSESLIELAGGLEELQDAASVYYDKFFTDEEKTARTFEMLTGYFGDMNALFPGTRDGFRTMVEGLDLTTEAGKEQYVMMLKLAGAADEYYDAMGDNLDMQNDLTESLRRQSETIAKWLADLKGTSLAPVMSAAGREAEYLAAREGAYAPGASTEAVSAYLNEAKEYLEFMRSYSGDYMSVYQQVTGDVEALAAAIAVAMTNLPMHGAGGLTSGPTITGEIGREWNVPTYEPQRSRFLESAPPQFWENLRGGGVVQSGGGGPDTLNINLILDGKVLARSQVKNLKSDGALADATRRMN